MLHRFCSTIEKIIDDIFFFFVATERIALKLNTLYRKEILIVKRKNIEVVSKKTTKREENYKKFYVIYKRFFFIEPLATKGHVLMAIIFFSTSFLPLYWVKTHSSLNTGNIHLLLEFIEWFLRGIVLFDTVMQITLSILDFRRGAAARIGNSWLKDYLNKRKK